MNTKRKGDSTEARLISKFIEKGFDVYPSFGENSRADMVIDTEDGLLRVQAKTGRLKSGKVIFNTEGWWSNTNSNNKTTYTKKDIDIFAVFCPDNNEFYVVEIEEAPKGDMGIRVEEPKNGQTVGIRWADDYLLDQKI